MMNEEENIPFNSEPNQFGMPEGYFHRSAGSILNKLEWLEEHRQFPALADLPRAHSFQVPVNYFDHQEQALELLHTPRLFALKKRSAFIVPEDYFEKLSLRELAKVIRDDEPVLGAIPRQNNFKINDGYFAKKERELHQLLSKQGPPHRVISIFRSRAWMAVAAMLVLAFGLWCYDFYFTPVTTGDCGTIACIDKKDILKSRALESLESDELYDLVNSRKLEEKLENKSAKPHKDAQPDSSHQKRAVSDDLLDEI